MIIGTGGHIDHGKTSLVRLLTGVDTDRLKEEKARGISIDLGFAYLPVGDAILGFVDVPGHERFIHNMLAGISGVDFALIVAAADDGVMPQTREHLAIIDLLGIPRGIIAMTKCDLVTPERREEVASEIRELLAQTSLADAPIMPVSSATGEGVDAIRTALIEAAEKDATKSESGCFRLAVDRCFTLQGAGTIVTGTVLSGSVAVADHVLVSPTGLKARVRSIHAQNRSAQRGVAGERCALNLAGERISKDAIQRGQMIVDPMLHAPTDRIDARLRVLPNEPKAITQWFPVRLHHASEEVSARIVLLGDPVMPGGEGFVQLVLDRPVAAAEGDRFIIRDTSAQRTIGGGRFLDLRPPARKRRTEERLAQLEAHAIADSSLALQALLERAPYFADLTNFARDRALSPQERDAIVSRIAAIQIPVQDHVYVLSASSWARLKRGVIESLESFHAENPDLPGMGFERLRMQSEPRLPAPAFSAFLGALARQGEVALDGAWVRLPSHEVRLTPQDEKLWQKITPLLAREERFRPPRVRDIGHMLGVEEPDIRRLMKLLGRMGKVDEIANDHFFLRDTVGEMVEIVADIAAHREDAQVTAALFRDRVDNGRKVAIQILEFFDRHGVTLRRGDLRRINKHRLDLFGRRPQNSLSLNSGREAAPVSGPDFKSGRGREPVLGGFDSHSLPPKSRGVS